jgi:hypothetical protein
LGPLICISFFSRQLIRSWRSIPSIADEPPLQMKGGSSLSRLRRSFGFFFFGGGDDLEEGLLSNSNNRRNSDSIKRDITVTLLAMCTSLFVRFLWLLLTIVGDILASDPATFSQGACAEDHDSVFLLFVTANSVPWVIYMVHIIAEPLPVFVAVWTMGQVGDNPSRPRR